MNTWFCNDWSWNWWHFSHLGLDNFGLSERRRFQKLRRYGVDTTSQLYELLQAPILNSGVFSQLSRASGYGSSAESRNQVSAPGRRRRLSLSLDSSSIRGLSFLGERMPPAIYTPVSAVNIYSARNTTVERIAVDMELYVQGGVSRTAVDSFSRKASGSPSFQHQIDKSPSLYAKVEQSQSQSSYISSSNASMAADEALANRSLLCCDLSCGRVGSSSQFSRIARSRKEPRGVEFFISYYLFL